jgi:valyl-tRNA synthetase
MLAAFLFTKKKQKQIMKNNYLIDTPPPTISGNLHIGHIFSYTSITLKKIIDEFEPIFKIIYK